MAPALKPSKEDVLSAFRRSALLESARQVFGECGFERATMERIAQEAGVAKGTVYLYYSSKQAIYDEALNEGLAELDQMTRARLEEAATLREAISAFIRARSEYFLARREFFRMYVAAITGHVTERHGRASEFQALIDRQTRRLEAVIARAVARREIRRVDPSATALAIFDLTRGLVARKLMRPADAPEVAGHPDEADFLTELIWSGLGRAGSAKTAKTSMKRKR